MHPDCLPPVYPPLGWAPSVPLVNVRTCALCLLTG